MPTEEGLGYPLHPPRSYTRGRTAGQPTVIVIHTTEGHETASSAEDGAAYDARRPDGTSTHFFVDSDSIVQCVPTFDRAHAARTHGNNIGIQVEICGMSAQTPAQWSDVASSQTLMNVARLCVKLRDKYGPERFPLRRLSVAQLRAGQRGFCGHVDVTYAFPEDRGTHTDPGAAFPWAGLFNLIRNIENPPRDEDMQLTDKINDASNRNRTVGDVLRDMAKWRGLMFGDPGDTANAHLSPGAPLAAANTLPNRIAGIEARLAAVDTRTNTQLAELKAQMVEVIALLQAPPA